MSNTPMTRLEAVNVLLSVIDEQPVNSIPESGVSDAVIANNILEEALQTVQEMSPRCSTDFDYPLYPEAPSGFIKVPANTLNIEVPDNNKDIVMRGDRLYDRINRTYVFKEKLPVNITWYLDYDQLPAHVRRYVTLKAARSFQRRYLGSDLHDKFTADEENAAWLNFHDKELTNHDDTFLKTPACYSVVNRRI